MKPEQLLKLVNDNGKVTDILLFEILMELRAHRGLVRPKDKKPLRIVQWWDKMTKPFPDQRKLTNRT